MFASLAVRVVQLLFAVVVLGLSVSMIKGYPPPAFVEGNHAPALFDYGAFCGGGAIVIAIVGIASCFVESLQGLITLALDCLAAFFLLAGGIAYAATIKVGSCNDLAYLATHSKTFIHGNLRNTDDALDGLKSGCKMTQASTAFLWFTFVCAVGAAFMSHLSRRSGHGGSIV